MMVLRCVDTVETVRMVPTDGEAWAAQPMDAGGIEVPVIAESVTVTRGWFQCSECSVVGVVELTSPMMPPLCAQPSCVESPRLVT